MTRGVLIYGLILLTIGFAGGFISRPLIAPTRLTSPSSVVLSLPPSTQPRSTQFFESNLGEARRVLAACRKGTIRGGECANAETAIITVESQDRFQRFRSER